MSHKQVIEQIEKIMSDHLADSADHICEEEVLKKLQARFFENLFVGDFNVSCDGDALVVEVVIDCIHYKISMREHKYQMFTPDFNVEILKND